LKNIELSRILKLNKFSTISNFENKNSKILSECSSIEENEAKLFYRKTNNNLKLSSEISSLKDDIPKLNNSYSNFLHTNPILKIRPKKRSNFSETYYQELTDKNYENTSYKNNDKKKSNQTIVIQLNNLKKRTEVLLNKIMFYNKNI